MLKKKSEPLVSVIMAEYNTDITLLKQSIESILKQEYKNFEFIIIDDCGKNNMSEIVKEFNDDRIKVLKNKENSGLIYSLNKALRFAKGKYIARMDTDDYSYANRLKIQIDFLEKNPIYDIIGGNVDYYDGKSIWGKSNNKEGIIKREDLLYSASLCHPTIVAKREAFLDIGGYPNFKRCEDYALWIELFSKGYKLYNMKDTVLKYHLSLQDYQKRTLKTRKDFFKLLKTQYKKLNPTKVQVLKMKFKNIIAGILPYKIMYLYHKKKMKG